MAAPEEDERRLVARLRAGEIAVFDAVYERWRARIFAFLVRLTRDRATSEDLLQETFLRLARAARRLAEDTRVGAFLFTVARNLAVSHRRWALLDLSRLRELALWSAARGGRDPLSPFERCAASETERRLERAVAALAPRYREVVLLVLVEEMAPAEAALVLGIDSAALRQRLARARAMMRAALEEQEGASPAARRATEGA
jgi:RNA polymerase sigma-70 factor (ECF subfamily)